MILAKSALWTGTVEGKTPSIPLPVGKNGDNKRFLKLNMETEIANMILAKSSLWTGTVEGKNSSIPYRFTCIWSIIVKWQGVKRARAREGTMNRDIFCSCINLNQIHIQEKCGTSVGKELLLYTHLIWIGIQPWQLCHLSFIAIRYIPDSRIPILKSLVLRFTHWGQIIY